jgi:hypothetical protein
MVCSFEAERMDTIVSDRGEGEESDGLGVMLPVGSKGAWRCCCDARAFEESTRLSTAVSMCLMLY